MASALHGQLHLALPHPDEAWPLWKLWQRGALGQDHLNLPPSEVQFSPLLHIDALYCQAPRRAVCGTRGSLRTMHAGVSGIPGGTVVHVLPRVMAAVSRQL